MDVVRGGLGERVCAQGVVCERFRGDEGGWFGGCKISLLRVGLHTV